MGNEGKKPERGLGRGGDRLDHFSLMAMAMITLIGNDNLPERGLGWRRDCLDGVGNSDNRGLLHLLLSHVHHVGDCSRSLTTEYFTFNHAHVHATSATARAAGAATAATVAAGAG